MKWASGRTTKFYNYVQLKKYFLRMWLFLFKQWLRVTDLVLWPNNEHLYCEVNLTKYIGWQLSPGYILYFNTFHGFWWGLAKLLLFMKREQNRGQLQLFKINTYLWKTIGLSTYHWKDVYNIKIMMLRKLFCNNPKWQPLQVNQLYNFDKLPFLTDVT